MGRRVVRNKFSAEHGFPMWPETHLDTAIEQVTDGLQESAVDYVECLLEFLTDSSRVFGVIHGHAEGRKYGFLSKIWVH